MEGNSISQVQKSLPSNATPQWQGGERSPEPNTQKLQTSVISEKTTQENLNETIKSPLGNLEGITDALPDVN